MRHPQGKVRFPRLLRFCLESLESRTLLSVVTPAGSVVPTTADLQQYMLELVNLARSEPDTYAASLGITLNEGLAAGTITSTPKQPLAVNTHLIASATGHSQWMIDTDIFAHNESPTNTPGTRMTAAGYNFTGSWTWGENIGWQGTTGTPDLLQYTLEVEQALFVDAGITGRGHRTDIMNPTFREVGVGIVPGVFQTYNALMATQDFATSGTSVFLTGVAYDDSLVTQNNFYTPGEGLAGITITATSASNSSIHFNTTTLSSGGYSLALPAGTYNVTASGGALATPIVDNNVIIGSSNVKEDFVPGAASINHAPTNIALSTNTIAENQPSGSTVGSFSTTDPDAGNTFTYALVTGSGSSDNSAFTITNNQLQTATALNFATKNSYSIRVRSTDQGGLSFEKVFTVNITKINHAPTVSSFIQSVSEETKLNFTLTNFQTNFSDPDVGDTLVKIKISSLPTHGSLTLGSNAVTLNQEIFAAQLNTLSYTPATSYVGADSFNFQGSDGTIYSAASASVNLTVNPLPSLSISDAAAVLEGTPNVPALGNTQKYNADFTVTLSQSSSATVTVSFTTTPGIIPSGNTTLKAAKSSVDFQTTKGTLTFLPGQTVKHILVPIVPNALIELNKIFNVKLSLPTNAMIAQTTATGTILNDDLPTVTITAVGSASETLSGSKGKSSFTITRSAVLSTPLTVTLITTGSATSGLDYQTIPSSVTILAGKTSVSVPLLTIDDLIAEGSEIVQLTAGADPGYKTDVKRSTAKLTILDNEPAASIVKVKDASDVNVNNAGVGRFMVSLDHASISPITILYTVSGTAISGAVAGGNVDYQSLSGSVTIPAGKLSATIDVIPFDDHLTGEPKETVTLTLVQDSTPSYLLATLASRRMASIVILDKK